MEWEADAPPDMANQPKLAAFLAGGAAPPRHAFFRVRRMTRVAAL
jgi:hypothetical protein